MNSQCTACVLNDTVYVTGTGSRSYKKMWTYNWSAGWKQLTDMLTVRRINSVAVVGSTLYLLGGKVKNGKDFKVIKSVETYNTKTSKWSPGVTWCTPSTTPRVSRTGMPSVCSVEKIVTRWQLISFLIFHIRLDSVFFSVRFYVVFV